MVDISRVDLLTDMRPRHFTVDESFLEHTDAAVSSQGRPAESKL